MLRMFVIAVSLGIGSAAAAQGLTFADVKAKNGVQLSAADLKQLMPGAKVVNPISTGSTRRWTNTEGTFTASTDGRSLSGGRNFPSTGQGSWRIADNGRYCVSIKWNRVDEDWCSYIFKANDKYYGVRQLEDNAPVTEFEFSK